VKRPGTPSSSTTRKIVSLCMRLQRRYGPVKPPPREPVLDALVGTILSQSTTDANSGAAFAELKRRFPTWEQVRQAAVEDVAAAIRRGGLANQKAPRIQSILDELHARRKRLSLEFVRRMPVDAALAYLQAFHGVGPKTAACVLLFACRQPVLPVDTHVHRVAIRLGLIAPRTSAAAAHRTLGELVPAACVLEFHVQLIRHGRRVCTARRPACDDCPLWELCPAGQRRLTGLCRLSLRESGAVPAEQNATCLKAGRPGRVRQGR